MLNLHTACLRVFLFFLPGSFPALFAQNKPLLAVDCDTVPVVASATGGAMTCDQPFGTLTGALDPTVLSYAWTGPGGFTSDKRVITWFELGTYTLTVTGKYGCTAQATAKLVDGCTFYPLFPPECPDVFLPPAETCPTACVRETLPPFYTFSNYGAENGPQTPGFCGSIHNDQWFAFVAGSTAGSITAYPENCSMGNGLQLALYPECGETPVACEGGMIGGGLTPITLTASGLYPGKVYYLLVDGYEGDECEYHFETHGGICTIPSGSHFSKLDGISKVCPEATVDYHLSNPPFATAFLWTAPPGALINGMPSPVLLYTPDGAYVQITFGDQPGFVSVRAINYFRKPSPPLVLPITMQPIPPKVLSPLYVCFEELPYTWGEAPHPILSAPGEYDLTSKTYKTALGCDSIVQQHVSVGLPIVKYLGTRVLCAGDCFSIGGTDYCAPGNYTEVLTSAHGCDSTVNFQILVNAPPVPVIHGGGVLTCAVPNVFLWTDPGAGTQLWLNSSGQVIGQGNVLPVSLPGLYILTSTQVVAGVSCTAADSIVVQANWTPPNITASASGMLNCANSQVTLLGTVNGFGKPTLHWIGPNGFVSTDQNPVVTVPGIYQLFATGSNGCTNTSTTTVVANMAPPGATATGGTLTCSQPNVALQGASGDPLAHFAWSGPNGFTSAQPLPAVAAPGDYTLTTTGANGCQSTATATVLADQNPPELSAATGGVITCAQPAIPLWASVAGGPPSAVWTGPDGTSNPAPISATLPGVYTVTATGMNGCTATASATVVADQESPVISLTGGTLTCAQPEIALQANVLTPGTGLQWTGPNGFTSDLSQPSVSTPGVYSVTATGSNGCTATASTTVVADQEPPVISLTGGALNCAQPEIALQANVLTPGTGLQWTGPGGFTSDLPQPSVSTPGVYSVTATGLNGCTATASTTVVADQEPPVISLTGGSLTCAQPEIALQAEILTPGTGLQWTGPDGFTSDLPQPSVGMPGVYSVTATGSNGCTATASTTVPADQESPVISLTGGALTCAQPDIALQANVLTPGTGLQWTGPDGFTSDLPQPSVGTPGVYSVTATGLNGCTATATVEIGEDRTPPSAVATGDTITCEHPIGQLDGGTNTPGASFEWSGPGGFTSVLEDPKVSDPGPYRLEVTNPVNGCTATATALVAADLSVPDITVVQLPPQCGDSLLSVAASSAVPGLTYTWSSAGGFSAQGQNVQVPGPGWYKVEGALANGCAGEILILVVPAPQFPVVSVTDIPVINCAVVSSSVHTQVDLVGCTFLWTGPGNFFSDEQNPVLPLPGSYHLIVTAPSGCSTEQDIVAPGNVDVPELSVTGGVLTCAQPTVVLTAVTNVPTLVSWSGPGLPPTNANPVTVSEPGTYSVVVIAQNGCSSVASVVVIDSCLLSAQHSAAGGVTGIRVFPNASTGRIFVQTLDGAPVAAVQLFQAGGALLRKDSFDGLADKVALDYSAFPAGAYLLAVRVRERWWYQTLILMD